jgi:hypothetical protein
VPATGRVVLPFLTQFADFDSWELAQKLVDDIPAGIAILFFLSCNVLRSSTSASTALLLPPE